MNEIFSRISALDVFTTRSAYVCRKWSVFPFPPFSIQILYRDLCLEWQTGTGHFVLPKMREPTSNSNKLKFI